MRNVVEALGGRRFLQGLGASISIIEREGKLQLKWTEKQARHGVTWCVVLVTNNSYEMAAGDEDDDFVKEFELSLSEVGRLFRKVMKLED